MLPLRVCNSLKEGLFEGSVLLSEMLVRFPYRKKERTLKGVRNLPEIVYSQTLLSEDLRSKMWRYLQAQEDRSAMLQVRKDFLAASFSWEMAPLFLLERMQDHF